MLQGEHLWVIDECSSFMCFFFFLNLVGLYSGAPNSPEITVQVEKGHHEETSLKMIRKTH